MNSCFWLLCFLVTYPPLPVADALHSSPLIISRYHPKQLSCTRYCCRLHISNRAAAARNRSPTSWVLVQEAQRRSPPSLKASSALEEESPSGEESSPKEKKPLLQRFASAGWHVALCSLIVINYFHGPWPRAILLNTSLSVWALIHQFASMMFGGTIVLSSLLEWLIVAAKQSSAPDVLRFWFFTVPRLDRFIVMPAVTAVIVSGIGQAAVAYGGLGVAPKHVKASLHSLATFALWWAATDVTTQHQARSAVLKKLTEEGGTTVVPRVLTFRLYSNLVSCLFVAAIYAIMVLKPGYVVVD